MSSSSSDLGQQQLQCAADTTAILDLAKLTKTVIMISCYTAFGSLAKSSVGVCQQHAEASAAWNWNRRRQ